MNVIFTSGLDLDKFEQDGIVKLPFESFDMDKNVVSLVIDGKVRSFDIFSKVGGTSFGIRKLHTEDVVNVNLRKYSESFYEICSIDVKEELKAEPIPLHQEEKKECTCSGCPKASSGAAYKSKQFRF